MQHDCQKTNRLHSVLLSASLYSEQGDFFCMLLLITQTKRGFCIRVQLDFNNCAHIFFVNLLSVHADAKLTSCPSLPRSKLGCTTASHALAHPSPPSTSMGGDIACRTRQGRRVDFAGSEQDQGPQAVKFSISFIQSGRRKKKGPP